MKKIFYLSLIFLSLGFVSESKAQVRVNVNIGVQPLWGPVGYDYVRYYYMPEIDVYYNVANKRYTYFHGNRWVTKSKLPHHYRNLDLYRTYKVVINDNDPWRFHDRNRHQYRRYSHNYSQVVWRDRGKDHHRHNHHRDDHRRYDKRYDHDDRKGRDRDQDRHDKKWHKEDKRHRR